jgi:hypothetical protein
MDNEQETKQASKIREECKQLGEENVEAFGRRKCQVCNNLDPRGHITSKIVNSAGFPRMTLELQFLQIHDMAKSGCNICSLIIQSIEKLSPRAFNIPAITITEDEPVLLTVAEMTEGGLKNIGIELFTNPQAKIPQLRTLGTAVNIFERSDSDDCFMFIKSCIRNCTENHSKCQRSVVQLPRRVLDLGDSSLKADERSSSIKLWETNQQSERYAALSYCWGSPDGILKTEKETINQLKHSVDWERLPKVIQDAISVTRRLGIRYIWIDSLCIVQDDREDWKTEASKMHSIYRNAFVTIAAVSSSSAKEAFLGQRKIDVKSVSLNFRGHLTGNEKPKISLRGLGAKLFRPWSRDRKSTVNARRTNRVSAQSGVGTWQSSIENSTSSIFQGPLSERGWTLQERALSTRIIHFTDEGIRWECLNQTLSEDLRFCPPSFISKLSELTHSGTNRSANLHRVHGFWRYMLMEYTSRKLTFRSDLLPALSGVAAQMHELQGSTYLAGLWKDHIIEDLCWWTIPDHRSKRDCKKIADVGYLNLDPNHDTLPTWSWISVQQPIAYDVIEQPGVFTSYTSLVASNCTLLSPNPFGQIKDGALILAGPTVEGTLTYILTDDRIASLKCNSHSQHINLDAPIVEGQYTPEDARSSVTARRARVGEEDKYIKDIPVMILDLGQWEPKMNPVYNEGGLDLRFALVLVPSSRVVGAFERIGICDPVHSTSEDLWENSGWGMVRIV